MKTFLKKFIDLQLVIAGSLLVAALLGWASLLVGAAVAGLTGSSLMGLVIMAWFVIILVLACIVEALKGK